jgi:hypothetical protein
MVILQVVAFRLLTQAGFFALPSPKSTYFVDLAVDIFFALY